MNTIVYPAVLAHIILTIPFFGCAKAATFTYKSLTHLPDLHALALIESGDRDNAIGRLGEISAYQITPNVWRVEGEKLGILYGKSHWTNKEIASKIAIKILDDNSKRFKKANSNRIETPIDTYCMWNLGFSRYKRLSFNVARANRVTRDASMRYDNLVKFLSGGNN